MEVRGAQSNRGGAREAMGSHGACTDFVLCEGQRASEGVGRSISEAWWVRYVDGEGWVMLEILRRDIGEN